MDSASAKQTISGQKDIVITSWFSHENDDSPFYKCAVATKYLNGVGIFTPLFKNAEYKETKTKQFRIVHKTGTKDIVISWLRFRQWITDGFEGSDPRLPSVDAYMLTFVDYINDQDFRKTYFPGVNVKCILVSNQINSIDEDRNRFNYSVVTEEIGIFTINKGLKSQLEINAEVSENVNALLMELKSRGLVRETIDSLVNMNNGHLIVNPFTYSQPLDKRFERDMFMFGYKLIFDCSPIKNMEAINRVQSDTSTTSLASTTLSDIVNVDERPGYFDNYATLAGRPDLIDGMSGNVERINASFYVITHNHKLNVTNFFKLRFKVSIDQELREKFQKKSWDKEFNWERIFFDSEFHAAKNAITKMTLLCNVKFEEFGTRFNHEHPLVEDFPNGLTNEATCQVLTQFVYNLKETVKGNGFMKLRKFGSCPDKMARMVWDSDAENVCKILDIPNRSIGSCSKKKFEELSKFC